MFDWNDVRQHLRGHGPDVHLLDKLPLPVGQDARVEELWWLLGAFDLHRLDMDPTSLRDWNEAAVAVLEERAGRPLSDGQRELLEPIAYWRLLAHEVKQEMTH